ncbi:MAG: HAD family phosphatase [Nitrospinota bacterium]|nr:MAG: HAD family phosphatase [Nitrospinota bacterium]
MRYKLIALDIDGTLLNRHGEVGARTRRALHQAIAQGYRVILCTGRRYRTARQVMEALGLTTPLVLHNGLLVKDPATERTLYQNYLSPQGYLQVISLLREAGYLPILYTDRYEEGIDFYLENDREGNAYYLHYVQQNKAYYQVRDDLHLSYPGKIIHIGLLDQREVLEPIHKRLQTTLNGTVHVQIIRSLLDGACFLEIMNPGASKWHALAALARKCGIFPSEIVAIGDEINDLEMVQHAGLGIAMGNAIPAVKAVARYVTASHDAEGVAEALERLVLRL